MSVRASPCRQLARAFGVWLVLGAFAASAEAAPGKRGTARTPAPAPTCNEAEIGEPPPEDASADELFRRGSCEEAGRHLAAALSLFQTAARRSPSAALARRIQARSNELTRKVASIRIDPGVLPEGASIVIGGKKYELGSKRLVDPGKVEIETSAPGYVTRTVTLELGEKEERVVSIVLAPASAPTPSPAPASPSPVEPPRPAPAVVPPPSSPWRTTGWVVLGIGGASVAAGGVTGYLALEKAREVRADCPTETTCSPKGAAAARSGAKLSTVSTVATVAGGGLALFGAALVIWGGSKATVTPSVGVMNGLLVSGEL